MAAFVAGLGTGGTLMGNARRLKEHDPDTLIVAAEPLQGELVQGLRSLDDGFIPPIIDLDLLDRKIFVSNRDSVVWTKKLLAEEGLFAGVSSGAIASIAVRVAEKLDEGNVVFVVCDDGWKYLSSGRLHASRSKSSRPTARSSALRSGDRLGVSAAAGRARRLGARRLVDARRRPRVSSGLVVLVVAGHALEGVAHLAHSLAHRAGSVGQPARAEHDERDHRDHRDLHR